MNHSNIQASMPAEETAGFPVLAILGKLAISALIINTIFALLLFIVFAVLDFIEDYIEIASSGVPVVVPTVVNLLHDWVGYLVFPLILLVVGLASMAIDHTLFKKNHPLSKARWSRFVWGDLIGFLVALVFLFILVSASGIAIPAVEHPSFFLVILFAGAAFAAFLSGIAAIFMPGQVDAS